MDQQTRGINCQYACFLCGMLLLSIYCLMSCYICLINPLPLPLLSLLTEPSDLLTYNFITKGPSDPGRRLLLTTSAGWLGRCPGVQCSSTPCIDKTTLHILALSSKLSPDTDTVSFFENVPQEIFARGQTKTKDLPIQSRAESASSQVRTGNCNLA